jgi:selT/selW/selH-like putative selenoprotein
LAAEISSALGVNPEIRKGSNGIFEVTRDDTVVYSKTRDARFPEASEVIAALRQ